MTVFDGVRYSLSPSLTPSRRNELSGVLDLNGAVPEPPYTHLIVPSASHAHSDDTKGSNMKIVTDRWVDRSIVLGKCQPEQCYSPDPAMIFSGVVACATDLSVPDLEVLSAGITALGGQWRIGLTRDVTHLFALRTGSDKFNTALHFALQTHMCIVTPHWFDDSVRLGRRVPETPYAWPDPPVLRPGTTIDLDDDALATEGRRRPKTQESTGAPMEGEHVQVWAGRRILLSPSLELGSRRGGIEAGIQRAGGVVVPIADNADGDTEEQAVDRCDVFITSWRSGKPYFKAARASLLIGTLTWLFSVESSGTLHSPLDSLLWYPVPRGGVPGLIDCEISITNYTGAARDYLKRLIVLVGAKFTPNMSQSNRVLVAGFQPSPKTTRALSWSIPVVNHTWLEDCFIEWRALTVGLERYIVYPPGIDFGKMLMTRHDEPPSSQAVPVPRSSGVAVPGGRGIGVIDLEQEETRDADYHGREHQEATSMFPLRDGAEGSRIESRPQVDPAKKTPSSSSKVKRRSISASMGKFVDHVIELPAGDDVSQARRTPSNGKRRDQTPVRNGRVAPRSLSRASSAALSASEAEKIVPRTESGKGKDEKKDDGKSEPVKRQTRLSEGVEDQDVFQSLRSAKSKAHAAQRRPDGQRDRSEDVVEKKAAEQAKKPTRRIAKKMTLRSDSELCSAASAGEESEGSVPPRRAIGTGLTTPVKSGMKPRSGSKLGSKSRPIPSEESDHEARILAADFETAIRTGRGQGEAEKTTRNGQAAAKEKEKEKEKASAQSTSRTQSPLSSPPDTKNARPLKRRLSVVVPHVPKDYFSSQQSVRGAEERHGEGDRDHESEKTRASTGAASERASRDKPFAPAGSIFAVSAEASTSANKRAKTYTTKTPTTGVSRKPEPRSLTRPKLKPKPPPRMSMAHASENDEAGDEEEDNDTSMIVETSVASTGRGGPRRSAANKASMRLKNEIMPDVVSFEKERKLAKRRRSSDWESTASVREDVEEEERQEKRRKVSREGEEEEEVEGAVVIPSTKGKSRPSIKRGKEKGRTSVGSDEGTEALSAKKRRDEKKSNGGAVIRLLTTGVTLSDDVVKRLTKLGVQMTTKPRDCTHLVAKGIVRTEKFLCAMPVSPRILTEEWANASAKIGKLLPESEYLLSDPTAEGKWGFKFAEALARAKEPEGGSNLFKQMTFYVTPKVSVDAKLLRNVVSAGGGQVQTSITPTVRILRGKTNRYVVSCVEDKAIWRPLVQEGFRVYSPELLLRGALRQEIEWERGECLVAG